MSSDPNRKSPRTFQCRDVLWETFEQMARELECSVDYLINEAMKQYARQRSQGGRTPHVRQDTTQQEQRGSYPGPAPAAPPAPPSMRPGMRGTLPPPPARGSGLPAPSAPPRGGAGPAMQPPPRMQTNRPSTHARSAPPPVPSRTGASIPTPSGVSGGGYNGLSPQSVTLSIVYQGEKVSVSKDRFVIGRGKQSSDLTLKDPNVSRQHAMIEYQNGVYFMVDMGSTNGVEYNGQRIARKQIAEGDTFRICDHDLRFTYR